MSFGEPTDHSWNETLTRQALLSKLAKDGFYEWITTQNSTEWVFSEVAETYDGESPTAIFGELGDRVENRLSP